MAAINQLLAAASGLRLGPELLAAGDFANSALWSPGPGGYWTVAAGAATYNGGAGSGSGGSRMYPDADIATGAVAAKTYQLTYAILSGNGANGVQFRVGYGARAQLATAGADSTARAAAGTYVELLTVPAGTDLHLLITGLDYNGTLTTVIDNVSLKEVL